MEDSEFVKCKQCGNEYEALTQEIASYSCPNCLKLKPKLKVLDSVRIKYLTKVNDSGESQASKHSDLKKN